MLFLLDTNVVSEFRKPKPHGAVVAWARGVDDGDLHLSAVTLGEIQRGIEITRRQDEAKAAEIEAWADLLAETYNVLPVDGAIFRRWARLMHGVSNLLYEDALIAATAIEHDLTVVTRDVKDLQRFGVRLLNPFGR